jgi:cellulose synthase/poly-beta-1,6-N-acetylglucosamine synthase-like glycosyltransferase
VIGLLLGLLIAIGAIHIGVPFAYFGAMRRVTSNRDYRVKLNLEEEPSVSILVPTYNEANVIEKKLQNILETAYPKEKLQILVVDGASSDDTVDLAKNALKSSQLQGSVLEEAARKGKSFGLNTALKQASGDLICISDAECTWEKNALKNATKYFSDPSIGSVSGIHEIMGPREALSVAVENSYRSIYRSLRIAESKLDSTPIAEGEIQLFRRKDLAGFDTRVGGDDTSAALSMVDKGLRAISAQDVIFYEPAPVEWRSRFTQKIRRGQHILQAFVSHRHLLFKRTIFSSVIFPMEFFLYIVNPILFVPFVIVASMFLASSLSLLLVTAVGAVVVVLTPFLRSLAATYLSNNLTMLAAVLQELRGQKQLMWTKIQETRLPAK